MSAAVSLPAPLRVLDADGSVHFNQLKKLALSPRQYLYAANHEIEPTRAMLIGTIVHLLVLGPRPGAKRIVRFSGPRRQGKVWDEFSAANADAEIVTATEWAEAEAIADAVSADPVARMRLDGARFEVPLTWEDHGFRCSTSGVDIITTRCALGDLKVTTSTFPAAWERHAFKMLYPQQLAFYRRGATANGIDLSGGLFCLGVESKPPHEIVDLSLSQEMIDFADRSITLWLEKLRVLVESCPSPTSLADWPGYAQSPVSWELPAWMQGEAEADDEDETEAAS
jgi:hypothetical protein